MTGFNRARTGGNTAATARPSYGRTGGTAAAPKSVVAAGGTKPTHVLKFRDADGSFKTITGLFVNESGSMSGKDKEAGVTYYVDDNKKAGDANQPAKLLKVRDGSGSKILTGLFVTQSRDGSKTFLKGKDKNSGVSYYVMEALPARA